MYSPEIALWSINLVSSKENKINMQKREINVNIKQKYATIHDSLTWLKSYC